MKGQSRPVEDHDRFKFAWLCAVGGWGVITLNLMSFTFGIKLRAKSTRDSERVKIKPSHWLTDLKI